VKKIGSITSFEGFLKVVTIGPLPKTNQSYQACLGGHRQITLNGLRPNLSDHRTIISAMFTENEINGSE
jgi:hypothetical protein